ncbi:hypothetical protein P775_28450 [Puniceibacterium antarcticum]|uniref:Uncharacterized protein n=1 Tax=Puniceibacterium antarcticum TaxID=1206336 RepID=A0A2G8QT14_9RHOB|nr:hypothetical protein [Puniceibacterium antarcticum]PIL12437.1 hypothetical protein P775_28450 [Puniceibacterium antarcticum]
MTRRLTASLTMVGIFVLIGLDLAGDPPNPYRAPPFIALGSGVAASGGFCGALPD